MGLLLLSEQTAVISVNKINQLIVVVEISCFLSAVQTNFLSIVATCILKQFIRHHCLTGE